MENNIYFIINEKYDSLSKIHKKLADYIKDNIHMIPFLNIKELSEKSKVSTSSITRFTREVGFTGYSEFQKNVTQLVKKDVVPMKETKESILSNENDNILKQIILQNANAINSLYNDELQNNYNDSISIINGSRKVFIAASRSSYSVGYYLYFMLKGFIENVELLTIGTSDISNKLAYVEEKDCLISISYARYTKSTYDITSYFHDIGCKIIAITDSYSSPIALKSSNVLLAKNAENAYSFVNAMTIANALVISLGRIDKEDTINKLNKQDNIAIENGTYL